MVFGTCQLKFKWKCLKILCFKGSWNMLERGKHIFLKNALFCSVSVLFVVEA